MVAFKKKFMDKSARITTQKKRGRKSGDEIREQVVWAIKNFQELERLEDSPLVHLPAVRRLAQTKYRRAMFPAAFALRLILLESVKQMVGDLADMPNYQRELRLLQRFIRGRSVAEISRELSLSREHVARTIQPRALNLVAKVFLIRANENPMDAPAKEPEHRKV
jgi:hypothetical protein